MLLLQAVAGGKARNGTNSARWLRQRFTTSCGPVTDATEATHAVSTTVVDGC